MKTKKLYSGLITIVLFAAWSSTPSGPPLIDAVVGATIATAPTKPSLLVTGSNLVDNLITLDPAGGLVTINFTGTDASATSFPGSLQVGISSNGCNSSGAGLPAGATVTYTNNPATSPAGKASGVFTWNVPENFNTTTIVFCAYNNFWNSQALKGITIATNTAATAVKVSTATYTAKTRTLAVKGTVTAVNKKKPLNGIPITIEDSLSGDSILMGTIRNNTFKLSYTTAVTYPPAMSITAMVSNTLSSPAKIKIIGNISEQILLDTPSGSEEGATQGTPYLYQLSATDTLGKPFSWQLVSGPVGLTVSSAGLVSWTPTSGNSTLGAHSSYKVNAISSSGLTVPFTLRVGVCPVGLSWMDGMAGPEDSSGMCM
jgi:hypothetical protein